MSGSRRFTAGPSLVYPQLEQTANNTGAFTRLWSHETSNSSGKSNGDPAGGGPDTHRALHSSYGNAAAGRNPPSAQRRGDNMNEPRKNARKTRGRPFRPGNPGRPKGARNKTTLAVDALLDGEAEAITRTAVEMAKNGDTVALRLCLDRVSPPRRDRPVNFALPTIEKTGDLPKATAALLKAVASGGLTPSEAAEMAKLLDAHIRAL